MSLWGILAFGSGNSVATVLALDALHLSQKGISVVADKLICQVETFQSLAQSTEHASDQEDPVRKPGKDSPYCPDPVLSVSTPWVVALKCIWQSSGRGLWKEVTYQWQAIPKGTHHSKIVLKKYSFQRSKVCNTLWILVESARLWESVNISSYAQTGIVC